MSAPASKLLCSLLLACLPGAAAAQPLRIAPDSAVLDAKRSVIPFEVSGLAGQGAASVASNVGRVDRVVVDGKKLILRFKPPENPFPRKLCLLVWRRGPAAPVGLARVDLLGRTRLPVSSRPRSQVTVRLGERRFGPVGTNWRGKAKVPIEVPPGTREATVEVTDRLGMVTDKQVEIIQPPYNRLALAALPERGGLRIMTASCGGSEARPAVTVANEPLSMRSVGNGLWEGRWSPPARPDSPTVTLSANLPGDAHSTIEREVQLEPLDAGSAPVAREEQTGGKERSPLTRQPIVKQARRLHVQLGVSAGVLHNLGAVTSPLFAAEVGLLYRLGPGQIGLLASVGYGWSSQTVDGGQVPGQTDASLGLIPLGLGLTYQLPLGRFSPFVNAGYLLQVVTSRARADFWGQDRRRVDLASGFQALGGAGCRLGPGDVVLQVGYMWSRVDNQDLKLLAGGLVAGAGYRIAL